MSVLQDTLQEAIGSLESAGEEWIVPLLHSIRWLMQWDVLLPADLSEEAEDKSFQSGWATMAKCSNPPRVAVWRAFLSAILHPTIFANKEMHEARIHEDDGPLKWIPDTLICYIDELEILILHGEGLRSGGHSIFSRGLNNGFQMVKERGLEMRNTTHTQYMDMKNGNDKLNGL